MQTLLQFPLRIKLFNVGVQLVHMHPQACAVEHLLCDDAGVMTVNDMQPASCLHGPDICLENEGQ